MELAARFVAGCWIGFLLVWAICAFSVKPTRQQQPLLGRLLYLFLAAIVMVLLNGRLRLLRLEQVILPRTLPLFLMADLIVFAGLLIAVWARAVLGRNWSSRVTVKEGHELIRSGPYRIVRHPIYSGLLLMIFGTALLAGQLGGFFALVICFLGFWIKLRQEEILLAQNLPGYREYIAQTKALVPFIL